MHIEIYMTFKAKFNNISVYTNTKPETHKLHQGAESLLSKSYTASLLTLPLRWLVASHASTDTSVCVFLMQTDCKIFIKKLHSVMRLDESDNWIGKSSANPGRVFYCALANQNICVRELFHAWKRNSSNTFWKLKHSKCKEKRFLDYRKPITRAFKTFYSSYHVSSKSCNISCINSVDMVGETYKISWKI